jgi:hypothetical protein
MKIEIFRRRHVFADDVYTGSISGTTFYLVPGTPEPTKKLVVGKIARQLGLKPKVEEGLPAKEALAPLEPFPPEVRKLIGAEGDRTPAVMKWAAENLSDAQYQRRYRTGKPEVKPAAESVPPIGLVVVESEAEAAAVQAKMGGEILREGGKIAVRSAPLKDKGEVRKWMMEALNFLRDEKATAPATAPAKDGAPEDGLL